MGRITEAESLDKKTQLGMWLGLPEVMRGDIKTQADMAAVLGVGKDVISRWCRDEYVLQIADSAVKLFLGREVGNVMKALIEKANSGDVPAIRLFMDLIGETGKDSGTKVASEFEHKHVIRTT